MALIILGLILWSAVHMIPSAAPGIKAKWIGALGKGGYMATFSLLIIAAVVLIVLGWRYALPTYLYTLSDNIHLATIGVMAFSAVLFIAARFPTRIKRVFRHPQLTGVALWALGHLLANGDSRSVALFGGMLVWSVMEMFLINHREGPRQSPPVKGFVIEIVVLALGGALFVGLIVAHPYLSGITLG